MDDSLEVLRYCSGRRRAEGFVVCIQWSKPLEQSPREQRRAESRAGAGGGHLGEPLCVAPQLAACHPPLLLLSIIKGQAGWPAMFYKCERETHTCQSQLLGSRGWSGPWSSGLLFLWTPVGLWPQSWHTEWRPWKRLGPKSEGAPGDVWEWGGPCLSLVQRSGAHEATHTHRACCHIWSFMGSTERALRHAEGCLRRAGEGHGMALCFKGERDGGLPWFESPASAKRGPQLSSQLTPRKP